MGEKRKINERLVSKWRGITDDDLCTWIDDQGFNQVLKDLEYPEVITILKEANKYAHRYDKIK